MKRDGGRAWAALVAVAIGLALLLLGAYVRAPRTTPAARPATTVWRLPEWKGKRSEAPSAPMALIEAASFFEVAGSIFRGPLFVTGVVLDEDGLAVPGASVLGAPDGGVGAFDRSSVTEARTDSSGRFGVTLPGEYRLVALHVAAEDPALGAATLRQLGAPKWGSMDVGTIVLGRVAVVAGRVLDAERAPLAGARVAIENRQDRPRREIASSATDAGGSFRLVECDSGSHLRVVCEGYATATLPVLPPASGLEIVLERDAVVRGSVVEESGAPIPGARVWTDLRDEATCDETGSFALRGLSARRYVFYAAAVGFAAGRVEASVPAGGEVRVEIPLAAAHGVSGVVVARETGNPIAGALIEPGHVLTGEDGRFRTSLDVRVGAEGLGDSRVAARHEGYAPGVVAVSSHAETTDVRIELGRAARVRGLVLDAAGRPLAGATLRLDSAARGFWHTANSDSDGRFSFDELEPGDYRGPSVDARGLPRNERDDLVTIEEGEAREMTIVVGHGRGVRGRVTAAGEPVGAARVRLWRRSGSPWFEDVRTVTSERGRFEMRGVGDGDTRLEARAPGFVPAVIDCQLPGEGLADIEIALERGERLEGRILLPDGSPAPNARVAASWQWEDEMRINGMETYSDPEGRFRLDGLPAAELTLHSSLRKDGFHRVDAEIRPPFEPIEVTLEAYEVPLRVTIVEDEER